MPSGYCSTLCKKYRPKDVTGHDKYAQGQKRCSECMEYLDFEGKFCPCCGTVLRTKPRNPRLKRRMERIIQERQTGIAKPMEMN